jgi:regulator of replication initiation timing
VFVDLLHREIDQLHTDKQRLTEELERLRLENAALRAGTVKPGPAARRAGMDARP